MTTKGNTGEWPAIRSFHLTGGIRCYDTEPPHLLFRPRTISGKTLKLGTDSYRNAYLTIKKNGLNVLGVEHFYGSSESTQMPPPDWRVFNQGWPSWEQRQEWSTIANSAFEKRNGYAWDLASRISQQWTICSWRIREISNAYENQLNGCSKEHLKVQGTRFMDGYTETGYIAIQSYLMDACILRDYLTEFLVNIIWKSNGVWSGSQVTSLGGLLSKKNKGALPMNDPLAILIINAGSNGGWLERLGQYRDLVVHASPLATAEKRLLATIDHMLMPEGEILPFIQFLIPGNPGEIRSKRASGKHFEDFKEQFQQFTNLSSSLDNAIDGLNYTCQTHNSLALLGGKISKNSPIKGKTLHFNEDDFLGDIKIIKPQ